jgi:hypothetical protein
VGGGIGDELGWGVKGDQMGSRGERKKEEKQEMKGGKSREKGS